MDVRIIKSPTQGVIEILQHRISSEGKAKLEHVDAIGLVQGKLIDMIVAADIAEKAVGVTVEDVRGTCPQHMVLLAMFGDTASVEAAIEKIRESL